MVPVLHLCRYILRLAALCSIVVPLRTQLFPKRIKAVELMENV